MVLYDQNARKRMSEELRRQIGEVDAEIGRLAACKEEVEAVRNALTALEAVLRRMSMLAREAAKPGERRPGLLEEFEHCRGMAEELAGRAVLGGVNLLEASLSLDDMQTLIDRQPG